MINKNVASLSRRELLSSASTVAIASLFGGQVPLAWAEAEDLQELLEEYTGGSEAKSGRLTLKMPEIAENGNTVPVSVSVESPMTDDDYVESVIILAELNPNPGVVTFNFSPSSGEAQASTRMRLATTQTVYAVAKMSDGSLFADQRNVKVTIGGCGG